MKIILHIGTHKTGSTALQMCFNENREAIREAGVYYPEGQGRWPGHPKLAWWFRDGKIKECEEYLSRAVEAATEHGCDRIFISSEEFSQMPVKHLSLLKEFGTVQVLVFLRAQDHYLESMYNQHVKSYDLRFRGSIFEFFMYHDLHTRMNYFHILQKWSHLFNEENVRAVSYSHLKDRTEIYQVVFDELEIKDLPDLEFRLEENPSTPPEATIYMARLNRIANVSFEQHQQALSYLNNRFTGSQKHLLPDVYRSRIFQRFLYQNRQVSMRFIRSGSGLAESPISHDIDGIDFYEDFELSVFEELLSEIQNKSTTI